MATVNLFGGLPQIKPTKQMVRIYSDFLTGFDTILPIGQYFSSVFWGRYSGSHASQQGHSYSQAKLACGKHTAMAAVYLFGILPLIKPTNQMARRIFRLSLFFDTT